MYKKQQGMGFFGFIFTVFVLVFFAFIAWQIAPIYFDNKKVQSVLDSIPSHNLVTEKDTIPDATNNVRNYMAKIFRVDNVTDVPLENIKLTREGNKIEVSVAYEVRRTIIANVDVIVSFDDKVQVYLK